MARLFKHGEHICTFYENEAEQISIAAEYLADGIRAGDRVLYATESRQALDRFRRELLSHGIDARVEVARGVLLELTHDQAHLAQGRFDCARMMGMLATAVDQALADGFKGLRTCGDMSWLLREAEGSEDVMLYETLLNPFFESRPASGMCQYSRRRLAPALVSMALTTHPSAVIDGQHRPNPEYRPATM